MRRPGFTLLELAVVVTILAVTITLCVVGVRKVREEAAFTQTNNNLKQMALAAESYNNAYGKLPSAFSSIRAGVHFPVSVHLRLIPFLEHSNLLQEFVDKQGEGETRNRVLSVFMAPIDSTLTDGKGVQNYAANLRVFSDKGLETKYDADMPPLGEIEPGSACIPGSFVRGTSNSILFATKHANCQNGGSRYADAPNSKFAAFFGQNAAGIKAHPSDQTATFQLYPSDVDCVTSPLMAQSFSNSGISVGLADGSVRFLSPGISPRTWNLALQPNEKMELGDDW